MLVGLHVPTNFQMYRQKKKKKKKHYGGGGQCFHKIVSHTRVHDILIINTILKFKIDNQIIVVDNGQNRQQMIENLKGKFPQTSMWIG